MAKFNVGDKVVIRKHKLPPYLYDMIGKVFTIKSVNEFMGLNTCYEFEETTTRLVGNTWIWSEESLKKVGPFDVAKVVYGNLTTTVYWLDGTPWRIKRIMTIEVQHGRDCSLAVLKLLEKRNSKRIRKINRKDMRNEELSLSFEFWRTSL